MSQRCTFKETWDRNKDYVPACGNPAAETCGCGEPFCFFHDAREHHKSSVMVTITQSMCTSCHWKLEMTARREQKDRLHEKDVAIEQGFRRMLEAGPAIAETLKKRGKATTQLRAWTESPKNKPPGLFRTIFPKETGPIVNGWVTASRADSHWYSGRSGGETHYTTKDYWTLVLLDDGRWRWAVFQKNNGDPTVYVNGEMGAPALKHTLGGGVSGILMSLGISDLPDR